MPKLASALSWSPHVKLERREELMNPPKRTLMTVLITCAISRAFAADAPADDAAAKDLAKLQGDWSMVSGSADGFPVPDFMLANSKRSCKGNEMTATVGGQLVM